MDPVKVWIVGIDEVGRGPLAGPMTIAAVAAMVSSNFQFSISPPKADPPLAGKQFSITQFPILKTIKDSKKLSPNQRKEWDKIIKQNFLYSIKSISPRFIDEKGIVAAARSAVSQCLYKILPKLKIENCKLEILLDGSLYAPKNYPNQQTIIKGDERVPIIAAASIVAKVHRDRYMTRIAKKFPSYGFEKHKGYGTKAHKEAIFQFGLSEAHRKSFCKFAEKFKMQS